MLNYLVLERKMENKINILSKNSGGFGLLKPAEKRSEIDQYINWINKV